MRTFIKLLLLLFIIAPKMEAQIKLTKDNAYDIIINSLHAISERTATDVTYVELAEAYFLVNDMAKAAKWYEYALLFKEFDLPQHYVNYSKALSAINQKDKAKEMLANSTTVNAASDKLKEASTPKLYTVENNYQVQPLTLNTAQMDFAPSFYGKELVFSSSRIDANETKSNLNRWTDQPYKNLYQATISENGVVQKEVVPFVINGSKGLHGSTTSFSQDGKTVYFTKEIYIDRKRGGNTSLFKICQARLENGKWRDVVELPFNTDHYSSAHPALSPDDSELYFVSDRVGSYGVSDIWKVKIYDNGRSFGLPEKLGEHINTNGKDSFPFVSQSGKLYFSSDGHNGHGGMDIFVVDITKEPIDSAQVRNLGKPINSASDDFTFIIDETTKKGYLSSNRKDGIGKDDIYSFSEMKSQVAID